MFARIRLCHFLVGPLGSLSSSFFKTFVGSTILTPSELRTFTAWLNSSLKYTNVMLFCKIIKTFRRALYTPSKGCSLDLIPVHNFYEAVSIHITCMIWCHVHHVLDLRLYSTVALHIHQFLLIMRRLLSRYTCCCSRCSLARNTFAMSLFVLAGAGNAGSVITLMAFTMSVMWILHW